jgi:hypothetical protein
MPMMQRIERIGVRSGHPALYKKLKVLSGSRKAYHLLKEVVRSQSDAEFHKTNGYSHSDQRHRLSIHGPDAVDIKGDTTFLAVNEVSETFRTVPRSRGIACNWRWW